MKFLTKTAEIAAADVAEKLAGWKDTLLNGALAAGMALPAGHIAFAPPRGGVDLDHLQQHFNFDILPAARRGNEMAAERYAKRIGQGPEAKDAKRWALWHNSPGGDAVRYLQQHHNK